MRVFWGKPWGRYKTGVIYADTDGLLDKCGCGAHAGFENLSMTLIRARCTDCLEMTEVFDDMALAMVAWNKARRAQKRT